MIDQLKQHLVPHLEPLLPVKGKDVLQLLETPRDIKFGQVALPVFRFSKELKKSPPAIAIEFSEKLLALNIEHIAEVTPVAGFVNFRFNDDFVQNILFSTIKKLGSDIGNSTNGAGKNIVIDFSSPASDHDWSSHL